MRGHFIGDGCRPDQCLGPGRCEHCGAIAAQRRSTPEDRAAAAALVAARFTKPRSRPYDD